MACGNVSNERLGRKICPLGSRVTEEADSVFCPLSIHLEEGRRHIHFILRGSALENSCLSWGSSTGHFSQELKNCGHLNPTPAT